MKTIAMMAKGLTMACSIMAGAAVSVFFMQDLLTVGAGGEMGAIGNYASLVSDAAFSLMAGFLVGWLIFFCLWECLANWLGNFLFFNKTKLQDNREASQAQRVEQTV